MRHRKSGRKLNRNASHRKALLKNLAIALVDKEIIKTTVPKAKELKKFLEPIITISKQDSVGKLFSVIGPSSIDRPGGYLRVIKAGFRPGDKADIAFIEWVDRDASDSESDSEPELLET